MTFLNLAILSGLALVAIPIIIHLLNRRKARIVDWGAMRFLLASLVSRNRRILIEEIILMCLRCLVVALVVLAMARPFLPASSSIPWAVVLPAVLVGAMLGGIGAAMWAHKRARNLLLTAAGVLLAVALAASVYEHFSQSKKWSFRGGQKDVAIVIDASASMTLNVGGKTNFQRAIEDARAVIEACSQSDAISVVLGGAVPRRVIASPTSDREALGAALAEAAPLGGTLAVVDSLQAAAMTLQEGQCPGKRIVLITDGQDIGWEPRAEARWQALSQTLHDMPTVPRIIVRTIQPPRSFRNAAVTGVTLDRKVVGTDRPVRIEVRVTNTGNEPITPGGVELLVDGAKVARQPVGEVLSNASANVTFEHQFDSPGAHVVTVSLLADDDMPSDNLVHRALRVLQTLPVLLVEGVPSVQPLGGSAQFMGVALAPADEAEASVAGEDPHCLVEPRTIEAADLDKLTSFNDFRAVVLADVPRLPAKVASELARYVQHGGGLLIALGADADREFYSQWSLGAGQPVAPALLGERRLTPQTPPHLALSTFAHPALSMLGDATKCPDAVGAIVKSYWPLVSNERDAQVRVGGLLESGEPMLVERKLGQGLVLMTPFNLDRRETNLPMLKCFLPMLHELAYYLASPGMLELNVDPAPETVVVLPAVAAMPASVPAAGSDRPVPVGAHGLKAEYFAGTDLKSLKLTRLDEQVNFDYASVAPDPAVGRENFSVRWTGRIQAPRDGIYTFFTVADDGVRLWVDGKLLVDDWSVHPATERSARTKLAGGQFHDIKIEYFQGVGEGKVQLLWSPPKGSRTVVPSGCLMPAAGAPKSVGVRSGQIAATEDVKVLTPSRHSRGASLVAVPDGLQLKLKDADEPGLYRVIRQSDPPGTEGLPFVITSDPEESRLSTISSEQLARLGAYVDIFEAPTSAQMVTAVGGGVPGEELWKYLAVAALLGLLAEIGLTRWIAVQRKMLSTDAVDFGGGVDIETFKAHAKSLLGERQTEVVNR